MGNNIISERNQKSDAGDLFSHLPINIQEKLLNILNERKFKEGARIYIQGAPPKAIYIIKKGRVKIVRVTKEGHESILCVRGTGDIFCPVPILDQGDQIGTAIALTDVELYWAEKTDFNILCKKKPELMAFVQGDCLFEVRRLLQRMEAFAFHSIQERLAFTILDELSRQVDHGGLENELRLKQQELAGLVGASRESISRTLSKLRDQGIVSVFRGRLVIENIEKLKIIANGD